MIKTVGLLVMAFFSMLLSAQSPRSTVGVKLVFGPGRIVRGRGRLGMLQFRLQLFAPWPRRLL